MAAAAGRSLSRPPAPDPPPHPTRFTATTTTSTTVYKDNNVIEHDAQHTISLHITPFKFRYTQTDNDYDRIRIVRLVA